jgi:hypothetical protein
VARFGGRWRTQPRHVQHLTLVVAGIVLGVGCILTGAAPLQLLGWLLLAAGLGLARTGDRVPAAWIEAPHRAARPLWATVRGALPGWTWPALVGVIVLAALGYMVDGVFVRGAVTVDAAEQFAKGLIGLAMIATLALLGTDGLPRRVRTSRLAAFRPFRAPASPDAASAEPAPEAP